MRAARAQLAAGADFIKIMASGGVGTVRIGEDPTHPELTVAEMSAIVEVANAARRKVTAHADGVEGIANALEAGVHCIEHGIYLTDAQAKLMAATGVALVPTLSTMVNIATKGEEYGLEPEWTRIAEGILDIHRDSFQSALDAGVLFATGTDGYGDMVDEIKLFTTYGMTPMRAIQAATRDAALVTDASATYGVIGSGRPADLLAVTGNPLDDLEALRAVRFVMAGGRRVA
jgi:imidazolonepropionase-like amidohydrolase